MVFVLSMVFRYQYNNERYSKCEHTKFYGGGSAIIEYSDSSYRPVYLHIISFMTVVL